MSKRGIFIISLDFELAWGFHSSNKAAGPYKSNILGARTVIPKLLDLFAEYDMHVTWAVVGALGCKTKTELLGLVNKDLIYTRTNHSLHEYIQKNVGDNEEDDPLHFAASLIDIIRKRANQYIASHSFSHFYALEPTLNQTDFEKDIAASKSLFPDASTYVFARNQVTDEGISVLSKYGFKAYRGVQRNRSLWKLYQEQKENSIVKRSLRFIDTYLPLTGYYDYPVEELYSGTVSDIRASSFLRPYRKSLSFLEALKLERIKKGMRRAAQNGTIYHLYWHPHNVGVDQQKNLEMIEIILRYYQKLNRRLGMLSMSMEEVHKLYGRNSESSACTE